ncbi:DUF1793-domain-containing protein, partial [Wolfiporia cocos MD-104 SS10]
LGWAGYITVNGTTYRWLGAAPGLSGVSPILEATLANVQVTPTRTIYSVIAGKMNLNITFLSPIEPSDWVRQSIPFSYISLEASSTDGEAYSVSVYSDITAEWLSGNRSAIATWSTRTTNQQNVYHEASLQNSTSFAEISDQAEDGNVIYAMSQGPGMTYQTGPAGTIRGVFQTNSSLTDSSDPNFRSIKDYPAFAFAVDLGLIKSTANPVVWALGYVRNPAIEYTTPTGESQLRYPYWATQYSSVSDVVNEVLGNFAAALSRATELDNRVIAATSNISTDYTDIVSLGARQAFAGIDITVTNDTDGAWDIKIFMKNIGTDRRVNPVEVMYAAYPMFLYFNSSFCNPLLSPLLEYAASSFYTLPYAASDLGTNYPIASGDNSTQQPGSDPQGVEQSANMLIMALAAARASGDGSLLAQYYPLLSNWTNYLVQNSEAPSNQYVESADGQFTTNMTNLAIKGIIGIQAMSEISKAVQEDTDSQKFATTASTYISTWKSLALSSNQQNILFAYGDSGSWGLMYNLYADLLLQTHLVDETIYQDQSAFYGRLIQNHNGSGKPLVSAIDKYFDMTTSDISTAWLMFTAATATNDTVRNQFISYVWDHASDNLTAGAFPDVYNVNSGAIIQGYASPAQGALFAPLALTVANTTIEIPATASTPSPSDTSCNLKPTLGEGGSHKGAFLASHMGAIVGGVVYVGGVGGLTCILLLGFFFWRRSHREGGTEKDSDPETHEADPFTYQPAPVIPAATITPSSISKMREYLGSQGQTQTQTLTAPAPVSDVSESVSVPTSTAPEPPSAASGDDAAMSSTDINGLRVEMENLRRAVQELRVDAPPEY